MRLLGRGSPRIAFVVGMLLSFPGRLLPDRAQSHRQARRRGGADRAVGRIAFCLIQQLLLEVPLVGYFLRPERTQRAVDGFRAWLARNGRRAGIWVAVVLGVLLIIRGIAGLVS